MRLRDFADITLFAGLGMFAVFNNALPSNASGSYYQNTRVTDREIVIGALFSGADYGEIMANRAEIVDAIDPTATPDPEPLHMRLVTTDSSGVWQSEMVDAAVHYAGGLEGAVDAEFGQTTDRSGIRFQMFLPYITRDGDAVEDMGFAQTLTNPWGVLYKDFDGQWSAAMRTTTNGDLIYSVFPARDGSVYVGGRFNNAGGDANADYLARWNGSAYAAIGAFALSGNVNAIVQGPDGTLYFGGDFTNAGGVAAADRIFAWDGSTVTALGTGIPDGEVHAMAIDDQSRLYVVGSFSSAGGVANTSGIAMWDGAAWNALGTGVSVAIGSSEVFAIAINGDDVYIGGSHGATGGVIGTRKLGHWDGTQWLATIGDTDVAGIPTGDVYALEITPDGYLYAGGTFDYIGTVLAYRIGRYNGTSWEAIPSPVGVGLGSTGTSVRAISAIGTDIYVGGEGFPAAFGSGNAARLVGGTAWMPLDVEVDGYVTSIEQDARGRLYLGLVSNTAATSGVVTVSNTTGARSYPRFVITGPGRIWYIKNETTGKGIYFNNLPLFAGETAYFYIYPDRVEFASSWRPNLLSYASTGTDFDFYLLGGDNNVAVFMTGTTAATGITMFYNPGYSSLDKTER